MSESNKHTHRSK